MYNVIINIQPIEAGIVSPSTDSTYEEGQTITFNASPSGEYLFKNWSGDIDSSSNPLTIDIDQNLSLSANFEIKQYQLNVSTVGEGTVKEEIVNQKSTDYDYGTTVELTANPTEGWRFNNWEGDIDGNQNPEKITIDEEKSVTAIFEEGGYVSHGYVEGVTPSIDTDFAERTYPTIKANWEGEGGSKYWTKMNIGATNFPEQSNDDDPNRRGWVFQFNRSQGFHFEGEYRNSDIIPSSGLESNIDEDSNWVITNDPCRKLLRGTWRVPTLEEWDAFYLAFREGSFNASIDVGVAYNSPLQLHSPFAGRTYWGVNGSVGPYWSNTQFGDDKGRYLRIPTSGNLAASVKRSAHLLRCIEA
jgi:hypothetical protein